VPNPIPTEQRSITRSRDRSRCARCSGGCGQGQGELHHRRTRSVNDEHQHCTCVLVLLCGDCHRWAHARPIEARHTGFWISRHEPEPGTQPFQSGPSWVWPDCDGGLVRVRAVTRWEASVAFLTINE
jgi:hypothetical protein